MITEKSCGAIVYTCENSTIKYVIIRSKEGIYGFPKGHIEGTEGEIETALREISEETGLTVRLIVGVVLFFSGESAFKTVGGFMTFIPLGIIVLQIILGIVVRVLMHFKKQDP